MYKCLKVRVDTFFRLVVFLFLKRGLNYVRAPFERITIEHVNDYI